MFPFDDVTMSIYLKVAFVLLFPARPRIYIGPKEDELAKGMAQMVLNNLNLHTPRLNTTVDSITKVNLSDSDNTFGSLFNLNHTVLDTCEKTYRRYSIVDLPDEENVTSPCLSPKAKYNIGDISVWCFQT